MDVPEPVRIGAHTLEVTSEHWNWLRGAVDEVKLYNITLSAEEVLAYCNSLND